MSFFYPFRFWSLNFLLPTFEKLRVKRRQKPTNFVDVFGHMIGETLLSNLEAKLSDQKSRFRGGTAPLPIYAALNVKSDQSALIFRYRDQEQKYYVLGNETGCTGNETSCLYALCFR